ncbi:uncharacterized protein LOC34623614, partial [Cyclospora cayetanensis]|uniref:Uncharacterized protein LOC34623614 n=1 Tax=Cyclospora cayetanensis TaxID=88456 RepID=A0A6P6RXE7_9EIME
GVFCIGVAVCSRWSPLRFRWCLQQRNVSIAVEVERQTPQVGGGGGGSLPPSGSRNPQSAALPCSRSEASTGAVATVGGSTNAGGGALSSPFAAETKSPPSETAATPTPAPAAVSAAGCGAKKAVAANEVTLQFEEFPFSAAQMFWPDPQVLPQRLHVGLPIQVSLLLGPRNCIWWLDAEVTGLQDGVLLCRIAGPSVKSASNNSSSSSSSSRHQLAEKAAAEGAEQPQNGPSAPEGEAAAAAAAAETQGMTAKKLEAAGGSAEGDFAAPQGTREKKSKTSKKKPITAETLTGRPAFKEAQPYPVRNFCAPQIPLSSPATQCWRLRPRSLGGGREGESGGGPPSSSESGGGAPPPPVHPQRDLYPGACLCVSVAALGLRCQSQQQQLPACLLKDVVVHRAFSEASPPSGGGGRELSNGSGSNSEDEGERGVLAGKPPAATTPVSLLDAHAPAALLAKKGLPAPPSGRKTTEGSSLPPFAAAAAATPPAPNRQVPPRCYDGCWAAKEITHVQLYIISFRKSRVVSVASLLRFPAYKLQYDLHAHFPSGSSSLSSVSRQAADFLWAVPRALLPSWSQAGRGEGGAAAALGKRRRDGDPPLSGAHTVSFSGAASESEARGEREGKGGGDAAAARAATPAAAAAAAAEAASDTKTRSSAREWRDCPPFCLVYVALSSRCLFKLPRCLPIARLLQPEIDWGALLEGRWALRREQWRREPHLPLAAVWGGPLRRLEGASEASRAASIGLLSPPPVALPCLLHHPSEGPLPPGKLSAVLLPWLREGWTPPPSYCAAGSEWVECVGGWRVDLSPHITLLQRETQERRLLLALEEENEALGPSLLWDFERLYAPPKVSRNIESADAVNDSELQTPDALRGLVREALADCRRRGNVAGEAEHRKALTTTPGAPAGAAPAEDDTEQGRSKQRRGGGGGAGVSEEMTSSEAARSSALEGPRGFLPSGENRDEEGLPNLVFSVSPSLTPHPDSATRGPSIERSAPEEKEALEPAQVRRKSGRARGGGAPPGAAGPPPTDEPSAASLV